MSDLKTERLLNLTMALLATKRLLTKDEIFSTIAGYSGSQESMERMFERDKDDLRKLGIEIDVGPIDPFFEDELGYRIWPTKYTLDIPDFTPAEFAILSLAGQSWRNQLLSHQSQRGLRKLESLGVEIDTDVLATPVVASDNAIVDFDILWSSVIEKRQLDFTYESETSSERSIQPYGLTLFRGEWYIAGFDLGRNSIRTFKVRRIHEPSLQGRANSFDLPPTFSAASLFDFNDSEELLEVELKVKREKAYTIRNHAKLLRTEGDWDYLSTTYLNDRAAMEEILWHGTDVVCLSPKSLVESIKHILGERASAVNHG